MFCLDTLENCVTIIVEKASGGVSTHHANNDDCAGNKAAAESTDLAPTTKIIYFMPRSATPFMTTINKPINQV